jgi:proteasome beta subunit
MNVDEAINLACQALWEAADVDSATGGPDVLRSIYPVIATITANGWERREDADLASRFDVLVQQQRSQREGTAS